MPLPMAHRLCLLKSFAVHIARPDPDLLPANQVVVADPHDRLGAAIRSTYAGRLDQAPATAGLREHSGLGVVEH